MPTDVDDAARVPGKRHKMPLPVLNPYPQLTEDTPLPRESLSHGPPPGVTTLPLGEPSHFQKEREAETETRQRQRQDRDRDKGRERDREGKGEKGESGKKQTDKRKRQREGEGTEQRF